MSRRLPNHADTAGVYLLCQQVCMVLRYVADEITLYGDDIAVSQR